MKANIAKRSRPSQPCSGSPAADQALLAKAEPLCEIDNGTNLPMAYEIIGDIFFSENDLTKSFFYYREYVNRKFEQERWLKNVPESVLSRGGVSAYKMGLKSQEVLADQIC